jgi:serine/threonine-protein phosphatase 2A activator
MAEKKIKTEADQAVFVKSPGYQLICSYLEKSCLLIKGISATPQETGDGGRASLAKILTRIEDQIDRIEPINQPMRFGNKAFRIFHSWLCENIDELLGDFPSVSDESKPYLLDSFGNPIRIDYGTGHEAAFFCFLIVLVENNLLTFSPSVILVIFRLYVRLVRKLTSKYVMEPAGSHGVWGLDDYHHLPFLFGAAQLIGHESTIVKPNSLLSRSRELSPTFLYAECIEFIKTTKCKHAPFHEVAPLLNDLSRMDNWSLVCYGLMQMYKTEVLGKRPITQHFYFGNTIRWE